MKACGGWKGLLWILLLGYTAAHLGYSIVQYNIFSGVSSGDFERAYSDAQQWKLSAETTGFSFAHPVFYNLLLVELGRLLGGVRNVSYFFYFLQFVLFPAALFFIVRAVSGCRTRWQDYGFAAVLAFNFTPFLETLAQHKVEGIEFFMICLALYLFSRRRDFWAGAAIFAGAALKYLPGVLAVYFLLKRESKVALGFLIAALLSIGGVVFAAGIQKTLAIVFRYSVDTLLWYNLKTDYVVANLGWQTLSGTVNRWFSEPPPGATFFHCLQFDLEMAVPKTQLAYWIALAIKAPICLGYLSLIRRRWERGRDWSLVLLEISLTLLMLAVVISIIRPQYGILYLPAFLITGLLLFRKGPLFRLREKVLFGLAYSLSGMLIPGGLLNKLPPHPVWQHEYARMYLWFSFPFYGFMLLGLCIVLCHRRFRLNPSPAAP